MYLKDRILPHFFIKPEWIPTKEDVNTKLNVKLDKIYDSSIWINNIAHRGDDIYVTIGIQQDLDYQRGKFLYNSIFEDNGYVTSNMSVNGIQLYNADHDLIHVGQKGIGPNGMFGFAISIEQYDLIKKGFFVDYTDYYLYEYEKIK